ncbi:MAG: Na(+)/H(+) antiporter subunit F [Thermoanaerobaculia bacterium]|nr:Na(+)/H(+) antiporter subunit F [Thermoanaerobaculia bacterium]
MSPLEILMAGLLLAAALCLLRAWRGPTPADRTVAVDLLGILMVGFCALLTVATGEDLYMIVGLSWALLAFVAGLALAKHLEGRRFDD